VKNEKKPCSSPGTLDQVVELPERSVPRQRLEVGEQVLWGRFYKSLTAIYKTLSRPSIDF
jgi:uncharacterized membrane protein (UPF0127 family)